MARWKNYIGSIFVSSGMKPKGDYPLMDAHDIVTEDGTRLDKKLENISNGGVEVTTDFTQAGKAADAKAVGDLVGDIHSRLEKI